ncbi:MAG: MotA/TolQ/ExbB proton channel family protein [Treponema sp.]|nr:MotA/TolQ/ExbB proton channel family protein [Treponema sp.]
MLQTLKSGGILIIPILLCGVIATFIIVERLIYYINISKRDKRLLAELNEKLTYSRYEECSGACVAADTPMGQVIKKAIDCRNYNERDLKDVIDAEINLVIPHLEKFLTTLGTIANIATMLGLLGTVTGNIKAFGVLSAGGSMGDPALLAGAIAEALVTTVAGLCVSIPSMIFNNFFVTNVNKRIAQIEAQATSIILILTGKTR